MNVNVKSLCFHILFEPVWVLFISVIASGARNDFSSGLKPYLWQAKGIVPYGRALSGELQPNWLTWRVPPDNQLHKTETEGFNQSSHLLTGMPIENCWFKIK